MTEETVLALLVCGKMEDVAAFESECGMVADRKYTREIEDERLPPHEWIIEESARGEESYLEACRKLDARIRPRMDALRLAARVRGLEVVLQCRIYAEEGDTPFVVVDDGLVEVLASLRGTIQFLAY